MLTSTGLCTGSCSRGAPSQPAAGGMLLTTCLSTVVPVLPCRRVW